MAKALAWGEPLYTLIYVLLIILFAFFYVGIVFNPTELADNMRKYGGFIPGIRPGRNTSEHINRILRRLTFVGGLYLAAVCLLAGMDDRRNSPAAPARRAGRVVR